MCCFQVESRADLVALAAANQQSNCVVIGAMPSVELLQTRVAVSEHKVEIKRTATMGLSSMTKAVPTTTTVTNAAKPIVVVDDVAAQQNLAPSFFNGMATPRRTTADHVCMPLFAPRRLFAVATISSASSVAAHEQHETLNIDNTCFI